MTEKDIRDKITQLRVEHNHLSEYQLSLELGQSKGYIQGITAGRSLPSMKMFLNICEYFQSNRQNSLKNQRHQHLKEKCVEKSED